MDSLLQLYGAKHASKCSGGDRAGASAEVPRLRWLEAISFVVSDARGVRGVRYEV
jgi:hypothetical protein